MPKQRATARVFDSVFTDLFSTPEYQKAYQALHPEDSTVTENDIADVTIRAVLVDQLYNDLGFMAKGRSVFLVEAQSTWCPNMAVRALMYLAETYQRYIARE